MQEQRLRDDLVTHQDVLKQMGRTFNAQKEALRQDILDDLLYQAE
jgi:hypothetical protein